MKAISEKVGADGYYANSSLDFDGEGRLLKINYRDNWGEVKLEQLRELTRELGLGLEQVVFIGDTRMMWKFSKPRNTALQSTALTKI